MKNKYSFLIKKGLNQPLQNIPYHMKAPLKRILLQDDKTFPDIKTILPGSNFHIAVHIISNLPKKVSQYVKSHSHNCDEINLILSESGKLTYRVIIDKEKYIVSSPAIVYLPRKIPHRVEVVKGKGIYVCIVMSKTYRGSLIKKLSEK
ncbi:2-isopropylmalate synthase [Candidatus Pacearchaeota archaeon]|nr:2-isopropylmalate synthase [Candidatus Pacearchaeota archaeon]